MPIRLGAICGTADSDSERSTLLRGGLSFL